MTTAAIVRGLDLKALAKRAGVTPGTTARALAGQPINVQTFVRLTRALSSVPVIDGADLLLSKNEAAEPKHPGDLDADGDHANEDIG
jgi:hypothetical protein